MRILRDGIDRVPDGVHCAVSIGAYDGIHTGHGFLLSNLGSKAAEADLKTAVVTFDRHPDAVVRPDSAPLLLTDFEQRCELFAAAGIDYLYVIEFDPDRASTSSEDFVSDVLVDRLGAKLVIVGKDFGFGKDRSGTVATLADMGERLGFSVIGEDLVMADTDEVPVSSTAIRKALAIGDIATVNVMLGRRFEVVGTVIGGDQRGAGIGFPTANIAHKPAMAWPANGVYAANATVEDGTSYAAAVNIGLRPTFDTESTAPVLEAHLLDFSGDLYGQRLAVGFVARLRDERRFAGIEELKRQLAIDIEATRSVVESATTNRQAR